MPTVTIKLGDIFDHPSDLIVLPCSTAGTVTSFVAKKLENYGIDFPKYSQQLGDIEVVPFQGGENIAQFVAYAASVRNNCSSEDAIRRIGHWLAAATNQNRSIRLISCPLLGAGSGGLSKESVVKELSEGFKDAHHSARLLIHVLDKTDYAKLIRSYPELTSEKKITKRSEAPVAQKLRKSVSDMFRKDKVKTGEFEETSAAVGVSDAPRVFISYCRTSKDHSFWVEQFADYLRKNGIVARLDTWHLRTGMELADFMMLELELAQRVIMICDEKYKERAEGRVGGVGYETRLIQADMLEQPKGSTKYLAVVKTDSVGVGLPKHMKGVYAFHWPSNSSEEANRETILKELYDVNKEPPIGKRPAWAK